MKTRLIIILISTLFTLTGCSEFYETPTNPNAQSITHNNTQREYVLYVPDSYDGSSPIPLVLNFHGYGDSAYNYMRSADMRPLAEANQFIVVYPQGSLDDGWSHWNPCPLGGDNKSNVDDFGFITALINKLTEDYNLDTSRIYAVGYSNGGMMAYGLANYKSDVIAAAASVSGAMLCPPSTSNPVPILSLHGTLDRTLLYDGNGDYRSVPSTLDYWVRANNTATSPSTHTDAIGNITIEHYVYGQGDKGTAVEHYKYIGGEHVWFSTPYQGKSTAQLVWDFFSQYNLDGLISNQ